MRTTVIPAQITSVEDTIAGNLNFTQVLLLFAALGIATGIYLVFPTRLHFTPYKLSLMTITTLTCLILAIRVKGKILLQWFSIISSFLLRPRLYIYNKNDTFLRDIHKTRKPNKLKKVVLQEAQTSQKQALLTRDIITVERTLLNPKRNVRYTFKKKGVYVSVS